MILATYGSPFDRKACCCPVPAGLPPDPYFGRTLDLFLIRVQLTASVEWGNKPRDSTCQARDRSTSLFVGRHADNRGRMLSLRPHQAERRDDRRQQRVPVRDIVPLVQHAQLRTQMLRPQSLRAPTGIRGVRYTWRWSSFRLPPSQRTLSQIGRDGRTSMLLPRLLFRTGVLGNHSRDFPPMIIPTCLVPTIGRTADQCNRVCYRGTLHTWRSGYVNRLRQCPDYGMR
jgi:hypothetical protein